MASAHDGFTARYSCDPRVWFQSDGDALKAIAREKELKGWRRGKKIALIELTNPARPSQPHSTSVPSTPPILLASNPRQAHTRK
jgi:predicted GIY-YIG superfamily endonuclease